jgi:hypothetical protein
MNLNIIDHLIKLFHMFSVDRNFKITQNNINKSFDQLPKKNLRILAVDRNFLNKFKLIELVLMANF